MATQNDVWHQLGSIPAGTIVAWCVVIGVIIGAVCAASVKIYRLVTKVNKIKETNEHYIAMIDKQDSDIKTIEESLKRIEDRLDRQEEKDVKDLRHKIALACNSAIDKGEIANTVLESILELYEDYKAQGGNHYVSHLIDLIKELPVKVYQVNEI